KARDDVFRDVGARRAFACGKAFIASADHGPGKNTAEKDEHGSENGNGNAERKQLSPPSDQWVAMRDRETRGAPGIVPHSHSRSLIRVRVLHQSNADVMNAQRPRSRVTTLPLVGATYFMVAGGPYGLEELISSSGYQGAILALVITPVVWSLPVALLVGELAAALPQEGGYYAWVA